jgi:hypothetical protein
LVKISLKKGDFLVIGCDFGCVIAEGRRQRAGGRRKILARTEF